MRDGYTRTREIEEAARSLVAWSEFIGEVRDHGGNPITADWQEVLGTLSEALKPLDGAAGVKREMCLADNPKYPGARCARRKGHDGSHCNGTCYWGSSEDTCGA